MARLHQRRLRSATRIGKLAAGLLICATLVVLSPPRAALADGGIEYLSGGLFHRKGWVSPEIHKRIPKPDAKATSADKREAGGRPSNGTAAKRAPPRKQARATRSTERKTNRATPVKQRLPDARETASASGSATASASGTDNQARVASLEDILVPLPQIFREVVRQLTPANELIHRIHWAANQRCVPTRLRQAIEHVARTYGRVRVNSTCRSRKHNRRVGGATRSMHLTGQAVDFRVFGRVREAARYLRSVAGGYKHYGGGLFHIDTGARRTW